MPIDPELYRATVDAFERALNLSSIYLQFLSEDADEPDEQTRQDAEWLADARRTLDRLRQLDRPARQ